jgi:hypothetical protein
LRNKLALLSDKDVDRMIILKWILKAWDLDWIDVAKCRVQWCVLAGTNGFMGSTNDKDFLVR